VNKVAYTDRRALERHDEWVDRWKVLLPMASSGDTAQDENGRIVDVVLGEPIALAPGSACTQSYLVAGTFDTRAETENYAHYLATKFVRFLVLQRKISQHVTPNRFTFVPWLDFNRRWTDQDLYEHFKLTGEEIEYIEASIKPRSLILSLDSPIPETHLPDGRKYRVGDASVAIDEDGDDE
jgi:site-specific DNA-methyltransferase (adenine-specific)